MNEADPGTCGASVKKCQQSWTCGNCWQREGSGTLWGSLWHCLWAPSWLPLLEGPGNSNALLLPPFIPEAGAQQDIPPLPLAVGRPHRQQPEDRLAFQGPAILTG